MATKIQPNVEELFSEKAPRGNYGKKVYNLLKKELGDKSFTKLTVEELLNVKGLGRKGALLAIEVAADLAGKK